MFTGTYEWIIILIIVAGLTKLLANFIKSCIKLYIRKDDNESPK